MSPEAKRRMRVTSALEALDATSRLVLTMRHVDGLGDAEIAAALDLPLTRIRAVARDAMAAISGGTSSSHARRAA